MFQNSFIVQTSRVDKAHKNKSFSPKNIGSEIDRMLEFICQFPKTLFFWELTNLGNFWGIEIFMYFFA